MESCVFRMFVGVGTGVADPGCFEGGERVVIPRAPRWVSWVGQRFALSERKGGRKPRVEKGPPDVSWVPGAPAGGGVRWAVAAAFPAEAWPMGGDCGHRARDPGRAGGGVRCGPRGSAPI